MWWLMKEIWPPCRNMLCIMMYVGKFRTWHAVVVRRLDAVDSAVEVWLPDAGIYSDPVD